MSEKEDSELELDWDDALAEWEQELDGVARAESNPMPQKSDPPAAAGAPAPPRPLYRPPSSPPAPATRAAKPAPEYNVSLDDWDDDGEEATRVASLPKSLIDSLTKEAGGGAGEAESRNEHDVPTKPPPAGPLAGLDLDLDELLDSMTSDRSAPGRPTSGDAAPTTTSIETRRPPPGDQPLDPFGGLVPVDDDATKPKQHVIAEPGRPNTDAVAPSARRAIAPPAATPGRVAGPGKPPPAAPRTGYRPPPPPPPPGKLGSGGVKPPAPPPKPAIGGRKSLAEISKGAPGQPAVPPRPARPLSATPPIGMPAVGRSAPGASAEPPPLPRKTPAPLAPAADAPSPSAPPPLPRKTPAPAAPANEPAASAPEPPAPERFADDEPALTVDLDADFPELEVSAAGAAETVGIEAEMLEASFGIDEPNAPESAAPTVTEALPPAPPAPPEPKADEPDDELLADLAPPTSSKPPPLPSARADLTEAEPAVTEEGDRGAQAARRTVKYRKPREEHMALVGRSPDALRARAQLLRALADERRGSARSRLLTAAAEMCERLGEADEARELYREARKADPNDPIVLRALRRDAMMRSEPAVVAELLEAEAALPLSSSDRAGAYVLLAEVQLHRLGDAAAAERSARTALGLRRGSIVAALLLAEACLAQKKDAEACAALERGAEGWADEQGKAALLVDVARTLERQGHAKRAFEKYRAAVDADGTAFDAWMGLARSARASGDVEAATQALLSLASQLGEGPIAEALRRLGARFAHVLSGRPADAVALLDGARGVLSLEARADAAAAIGDAETRARAVEAWAQATGGTERALALVLLAQLRAEAGDLEGADAALRDAALADENLGTVQVVREVLARRAGDTTRLPRAVDMSGEGPGASIAAAARIAADANAGDREQSLLAAAELEGESLVTADVILLDVAARRRDEETVRAALRRQTERASPETKIGPLLALADEATSAGDVAAARELLQEARDVSPGDPVVLRPLGRLLLAGEPRDAAAPWLEECAAATSERAAHAAVQAARMLAAGGTDSSPALRRALDVMPGYLPAAWALEPRLRDAEDVAALADLHERVADVTEGPIERAGRWIRAALLRGAEDPAAAAALLERARRAAPNDAILYELMLRLGDGMSPAERGALLVASAQEAPPDLARSARLRAAAAFDLAGDPAQAASLYRGVLAETDGTDPIALRALDRTELAAGEHARVAERRFDDVKLGATDEARVTALERMADLDLEERGEATSAMLSLQSILEIAPGHVPSLRALETHYMDEARDEDLAGIEELFATHIDTGPDALAHARLAARLLLRPEDAAGEAADRVLLAVAERAKMDLWLARRVAAAAAVQHDRRLVARASAKMVELLSGEAERVEAALRAGEALVTLDDPRTAADVVARVFEACSDYPTAGETLGHLREQLGDPRGAADAYEASARAARVPRHAARLWHKAGVLWQDALDDPDRAVRALIEASSLAPTYGDVFDRLKRLLVARGEIRELAELTERRLSEGGEPAVLVELHVTLAEMREELGAPTAAKEALRAALALDPERLDALRRLADLSLSDEDWRGAAEALIKIARLRKDRDELRWVFFTLGDIYDSHMPDPRRAEAAFQRVLKLIPDDTEAMERLATLYRSEGNTTAAADMLQKLAQHELDPDRSRDYQIRLAASLESQGDLRQAESVLEQARKKNPIDLAILRALAELYQRQNAHSAQSMHMNRAVADFRQALARDPADPSVWPGLVEVLAWRGQPDAARCVASSAFAIGVTDVELAKYVDPQGGVPGAGSAAADDGLDDVLAPPQLTRATRALFRMAGDALDKALPFDLKAFRADKVPREHAFRSAQLEVGRWFGIPDLQIYQTYQAPRVCVAVSSSPVVVLVGGELFTSTDDREKLFLLARAVKVAKANMAVAVRSQPEHLGLAVAGLIRSYAPKYPATGLDQGLVDDMAHRVAKLVHRRVRDELFPIVMEIAGTQGFDPSLVGLYASELGDRAALLATGSVPAAIDALLELAASAGVTERSPSGRVPAIQRVPEAWSLLEWSLSDGCFEIRQRIGADRA